MQTFKFANFRYVFFALFCILIQQLLITYTNFSVDNISFQYFQSIPTSTVNREVVAVEEYQGEATRTTATPAPFININGKTCNELCNNPIPSNATSFTTNCVEVFVVPHYLGLYREGTPKTRSYQWKYQVKFINHGLDTVQLIAEQWIFVDFEGSLHEIKKAGVANTATILKPGDEWSYKSTAKLKTSIGSMKGLILMKVLSFGDDIYRNTTTASESVDTKDTAESKLSIVAKCQENAAIQAGTKVGTQPFIVAVPRLSLTGKNNERTSVPCEDHTQKNWLPTVSVRSTKRIVVSATCKYITQVPNSQQHIFQYYIEILNAQTFVPIKIISHEWIFQRLGNEIQHSNAPVLTNTLTKEGLGGYQNIGVKIIKPNKSFRYAGKFEFQVPRTVVSGKLKVTFLKRSDKIETQDVIIDYFVCNKNEKRIDPTPFKFHLENNYV
jgi:uncharacterized protein affecting Mg2+/Co2+ transport